MTTRRTPDGGHVTLLSIATATLKCAMAHGPDVCLVGNVRAAELARLAADTVSRHGGACPMCGSEPWVNIDCGLCLTIGRLEISDMTTRHTPDGGHVTLLGTLGTDRTIVEDARQSSGSTSDDLRLIGYLLRHRSGDVPHWGPFELAVLRLEVTMPICLMRQWMRTTRFRVVERSRRYSSPDRCPVEVAVTGDDELDADIREATGHYLDACAENVRPELARYTAPQGMMTTVRGVIDLRSALFLCLQRRAPGAQREIRPYAEALEWHIQGAFPHTYRAWLEHHAGAETLCRSEVAILRRFVDDTLSASGREALRDALREGVSEREYEERRVRWGL